MRHFPIQFSGITIDTQQRSVQVVDDGKNTLSFTNGRKNHAYIGQNLAFLESALYAKLKGNDRLFPFSSSNSGLETRTHPQTTFLTNLQDLILEGVTNAFTHRQKQVEALGFLNLDADIFDRYEVIEGTAQSGDTVTFYLK